MDTKTKYLGLEIESPVVVGSCGLTNDIDNLVKMEQAGAVFLPADGSRFDTDIYSVGEYGYYQSATMINERNDDYSFYFYFYNEKAAVEKDYTCYGCSVRLVK